MKKWMLVVILIVSFFSNVLPAETQIFFENFEGSSSIFYSNDNNGSGAKWGKVPEGPQTNGIAFPWSTDGMYGDDYFMYCAGVGYETSIFTPTVPLYRNNMSTQIDNPTWYNTSNELYSSASAVYLSFDYNIPSIDGSAIGDVQDRMEVYVGFNGTVTEIFSEDDQTSGWVNKKIDIRQYISGKSSCG